MSQLPLVHEKLHVAPTSQVQLPLRHSASHVEPD
jgi:hypothetical protein